MGSWGRDQDHGVVAMCRGAQPWPCGCRQGRGGTAKAVGAGPRAVEEWPRPWVCCQEPWGRDQERGSTDRGRAGAAKTVGVQPGAVGVQLRPWGHSQDHGGTAKGRGGAARGCGGLTKTVGAQPGAVGVWPRPYGCRQGRCQDRGGAARGR